MKTRIVNSYDYFQEIINPDFEKIDSPFQQTSSLKPYVPTVILKKIIIDLKVEVVSLLKKEKANLETIESLKSKGFESSENAIFESENQSENDCQVVEKECDQVENSKVIALGMFSHSKPNKDVKRYSRKDLLSCNNSHLGETSYAYDCNDDMNVSCNSRLYDSFDENNLFTFDDVSVRNSPVSKMSFRKKPRDSKNIVQICLWIIDSRCSKHMTGNRALLTNFVKKFLGTVRIGNNDFAVIVGYGDVVIRSMTIKKVYCVEGLGHNLFSVGQFCDKGLEVAFRKSTCFVRNEDGVDLLTGLPEMKFEKDHLCSACEQGKIHRKNHKSKMAFALNKPLYLLHMDLCGLMRVEIQRVRTENGMEFKNKTLAKFFDEAEAIATACFTQNRSIIHKRFDKTPYELMNKRKPNIKFFRVFGCRCYLLNDYEDVGKLKAKGDIGVFVGYSKESIMKSSTTSVETFNVEIPSNEEEVFHEISESFQEESSSSSLNDDVQQSSKEVGVPSLNTQSISNNMIPNVDEASTSHNVFKERLEDAYFDATLRDADWVSAMQEELDQFTRLKVWRLVPRPEGKTIGKG
uniref:Retrovirus-related Pol polyprotein from transposon TNT 1-94-like beta-barrel domain-containing protein n=1 Tax=Tanacetum cinerariifolium TaxID=118510 RepID=A0A6L2L600_TANCI|nr:hypothetical protein [Tanacetum cinerariifolium]